MCTLHEQQVLRTLYVNLIPSVLIDIAYTYHAIQIRT